MSVIARIACAAALIACPVAQVAAQEPARCITSEEVRAVALTLMPDLLTGVAQACRTALPETALLRRTDAPFFARFQAEVAPNSALARAGLSKVAPADIGPLLETEQGLKFASAFLIPAISKDIKPADCPLINSVVEDLEPLPPRNIARLIATGLEQADRADARKGRKRAFPFCGVAAPR